MKYNLLLIFYFIFFYVNAQTVQLKVIDYSTKNPIENADAYFTISTESYISDKHGKISMNLAHVNPTEELIVSKKEYQSARINATSIQSNLIIKLEKIEEIDLNEAYFTNLKTEDILRKVIENYDKNFNVNKFYFLVDLKQNFKIDTVYENYINLNLQLKFDKGKVKAKSSGIVKNKHEKGIAPLKLDFDKSDYFKHLYVLEGIKSVYDNLLKNQYTTSKLGFTEYAEKKMYEIHLENKEGSKNYFLIDRETFSVVEYKLNLNNRIKTNKNTPLQRNGIISFRYRPYRDAWVLKDSEVNFKMYLEQANKQILEIDFFHQISAWNFSNKPFEYFNKTIDLNQNLHDRF